MSLAELNSSQLEKLVILLREKEAVIARLKKVEHLLQSFENGAAPSVPVQKLQRRSRRSSRKKGILRALKAAGSDGLTVRQIAEKIGSSYANVSVWFSSTGRKVAGIKKLAPATYNYISARS
jgi:DNA-binding NarL/FixJ family response regulator